MNRILIDFEGGTHGNFLEFLLNKLFHQNQDIQNPQTSLGTSHNKSYNPMDMKFVAWHYARKKPFNDLPEYKEYFQKYNDIIVITVNEDDLLMLNEISLLRAGDRNLVADQLEINTYNKLNDRIYLEMLGNLITSYNLDITAENPDVPRHILREFFKFGYKTPRVHWFTTSQQYAFDCLVGKNIVEFPFSAFYNFDKLCEQLQVVSDYFDLNLEINRKILLEAHNKFLDKIPNLNIKVKADTIINAVVNKENIPISNLSLFQESYINGKLENIFNKEMPFKMEKYFTSTGQILEYLNEI